MSGAYDFLVMLREKNLKAISMFVSEKLAALDEVQSTTTYFTLIKYKEQGFPIWRRKRQKNGGHTMRDFTCKKIVEMPSSGIRKFFDIVTEMPDAISWAWANRISTRPGRSAKKPSGPSRPAKRSTPPTRDFRTAQSRVRLHRP